MLDFEVIINNAFGNILAVIISSILGLVFLDKKKLLAPWLYKLFGQRVTRYLYLLIRLIVHPLFRIILSLIFLVIINYKGGDIFLSILVFLMLMSFLQKSKFENKFLPVPKILDDFKDMDQWTTKTGSPKIENDFGKPAPDLGLKKVEGHITNSFVLLKDIKKDSGVIECDFYLEPGSLFNIVFFADPIKENWYMARYDSREKYSDGFLIKNQVQGTNWKNFRMSGTRTNIKKWHRARVEFNSTRVAMYKDGELIIEFDNPTVLGRFIGMFNEVNCVHVDNFSFTENL